MSLKVSFPGGVAVNAEYRGQIIRTDQPPEHGGGGTAPTPFDLFLASLGTCAGFYALRFCQERSLSTEGLGLELSTELNPETRRIDTIHLALQLPAGFPDRYRSAIQRVIDQCAVKRHIVEAPRFELTVQETASVPHP